MLGDEGDELENKMRKAVLSLGETGFDESEHLSKENKMFDRAPALDSEGESNETAKQHANLWVEERRPPSFSIGEWIRPPKEIRDMAPDGEGWS